LIANHTLVGGRDDSDKQVQHNNEVYNCGESKHNPGEAIEAIEIKLAQS
jgi:hypothetical protein